MGELDWSPSRFDVTATRRDDGSMLLTPDAELAPYPDRVTDPLDHWATETPDQIFVARRDEHGHWTEVSYAEAHKRVRAIAGALAELDLSADRPLLILSGNSIEHLLLGLAAMYIGVPYCPVSPAYSRSTSDLSKLRYVVESLTPGLVASFDEADHDRAIESTVPTDVAVLCDAVSNPAYRAVSMTELEAGDPVAAEPAHESVEPDTIAKFLLTSGSTGKPKPVITTHRMLCSNQVMLREAVPFVADEPPVLVDWLPWNHTFGGSHNVGLALFNGGSLYIDDGKPIPGLIEETVRNLREISPTIYLNVPKGYELLAEYLNRDDPLRRRFFKRLRACFFAGAALSQHTWDALDAAANTERGSHVPILSGLGCTEASPSITFTSPKNDRAGVIGLPAAGNEVKLVPVAGKLELRARGPNITPGYWRLPDQTAAAFDDEGFYKLGDAAKLIDPDDAAKGMVFDGRISEDFKLASGTWVSTGPLRLSLLAALEPVAQDVVIAGLNEDYIGILIAPDLDGCRALVRAGDDTPQAEVLRHPALRAAIIEKLGAHKAANRASSMHARRAILLTEPLSIDKGEITDKGSVNQGAVLRERQSLVADLYADPPPDYVTDVDEPVG